MSDPQTEMGQLFKQAMADEATTAVHPPPELRPAGWTCSCAACEGQKALLKPAAPTAILTGAAPYLAFAGQLVLAVPGLAKRPTVATVGYAGGMLAIRLTLTPTRWQRFLAWLARW